MVDDFIVIEKDIQINIARSLVYDFFAAHGIFNTLEFIQKSNWLQCGLNLIFVSYQYKFLGKGVKSLNRFHKAIQVIESKRMDAENRQLLTSQAPLTKLSWSRTYIGSVSHKQLVLLILIPLAAISLQAFSIISIRSPRLLPRAIYAVWVFSDPFKEVDREPRLSLSGVDVFRGCWTQGLLILAWVVWLLCRTEATEEDIVEATLHLCREQTFLKGEAPALASDEGLRSLIWGCCGSQMWLRLRYKSDARDSYELSSRAQGIANKLE